MSQCEAEVAAKASATIPPSLPLTEMIRVGDLQDVREDIADLREFLNIQFADVVSVIATQCQPLPAMETVEEITQIDPNAQRRAELLEQIEALQAQMQDL